MTGFNSLEVDTLILTSNSNKPHTPGLKSVTNIPTYIIKKTVLNPSKRLPKVFVVSSVNVLS